MIFIAQVEYCARDIMQGNALRDGAKDMTDTAFKGDLIIAPMCGTGYGRQHFRSLQIDTQSNGTAQTEYQDSMSTTMFG